MLFCTTHSCPVASGNFLIDNLNLIAISSKGLIHVRGTITHMAYALGLIKKLSHLTAYYGCALINRLLWPSEESIFQSHPL